MHEGKQAFHTKSMDFACGSEITFLTGRDDVCCFAVMTLNDAIFMAPGALSWKRELMASFFMHNKSLQWFIHKGKKEKRCSMGQHEQAHLAELFDKCKIFTFATLHPYQHRKVQVFSQNT